MHSRDQGVAFPAAGILADLLRSPALFVTLTWPLSADYCHARLMAVVMQRWSAQDTPFASYCSFAPFVPLLRVDEAQMKNGRAA